ncbi:MAG: hypothetical protein Nkreftii_001903 [Candidatus Nitrospira kreftii]|uniref:Uncharacterized protein n=1 Tax=Candidatus Nitrospira kreftii TaxID=2652173 RepID=A0A7S8FDL4_9BACT|nr:MAG: hypothetical protein Nkreftii_001903 [Candidatus Nitrospira kreftii]
MKCEGNHNMGRGARKIRECMERVLGDLLTVRIEGDYNAVTIMREVRIVLERSTAPPLTGSVTEPEKERNLASSYRVRLSSC